MRRAIVVVVLAALWAGIASAAPKKKEDDDWGEPNSLRDLIKKAAEEDVPLAILYQVKNSTCPKHNAKVELFEKQSSLRRMDRCRIYACTGNRQVTALRSGIPHLRYCPYLLFTDGEGHLIGYVPYEGNATDVMSMSRLARDVTRWKKLARPILKDVATQIEEKRFPEAVAAVTKLEQEDRDLTGRIDWWIRKICQKTPKPTGDAAAAPGELDEQDRPQGDADSKESQDDLPPRPEPAETGVLLGKALADTSRTLRLAIEDRLTRTEILIVQGNLKEAQEAIDPLMAVEADKELHKKVLDLKAQIDKARADGGEAPPKPAEPTDTPSPTGQSPESPESSESPTSPGSPESPAE
ncbi:MAG: hypothetical protein JXL80_06855 [Planctomycetes bacterium]|nr:hypothetical protein [Planctomycetota bacterium]